MTLSGRSNPTHRSVPSREADRHETGQVVRDRAAGALVATRRTEVAFLTRADFRAVPQLPTGLAQITLPVVLVARGIQAVGYVAGTGVSV